MILLFFFSLFAKPDSSALQWKAEREFHLKSTFITADEMGNLYVVNKDEITKYGIKGDSICTQSFKTMGWISLLDVTNPLRPMIFYRDLNQIVVLDNTLSIQGEPVKLEKLGLQFTKLFCQSPNNQNLWLYDTDEFRLMRLDKNFQLVRGSGNITQVTGRDLNPTHMQEWNNFLYLCDPDQGILVFDMFATYSKTIPLKNIRNFQVTNGGIFYLDDKSLLRYDLMSFETMKIPLPLSTVESFRISGKRLYLQGSSKISVFSLQ
ncbi:MAG: hypothetical protein ACK40M_13505 [Flavobacteriales bacterium]